MPHHSRRQLSLSSFSGSASHLPSEDDKVLDRPEGPSCLDKPKASLKFCLVCIGNCFDQWQQHSFCPVWQHNYTRPLPLTADRNVEITYILGGIYYALMDGKTELIEAN